MSPRSNPARVLAILICVIASFHALGYTNSPWFTRVWQIDDGLVDNDINGIVQGPDGFLWIITPVGVMQFDGANFTPFPSEKFGTLVPARVRHMICGPDKVLWTAFDNGKVMGLRADYSLLKPDSRLMPPHHVPVSLAGDANGAVWLGYPDYIYRIKNSEITKLTAQEGIPSGTFHSLTSDGTGDIWLVKGNEVDCFKDGKFSCVTRMEGVQRMAATHTNAIWIVANAHLFSCDASGKLLDCGAFYELANIRTLALMEDHTGALWIGTEGNGLFRFNQLSLERIETSHSSILSLLEDREGNIWAGTGGGGLDRITRRHVWLDSLENSPVHSQIQSICEDVRGVLWGATQNGVLIYQTNNTWKRAFSNSSRPEIAACVAADKHSLWVGMRDGRLLRIDGTNGIDWETNISEGPIRGLFLAANGDVWIIGNDALQRLHGTQLENVGPPRQLPRVFAITEDIAGNVWIGANEDLWRYNGMNLVNETWRLKSSGRPICCLYSTPDGSLWIGDRGGGLMRLKDGHVSQLERNQGLVNNYISQIISDERGWLWFGSKRGVFKIRLEEIQQAMDDPDFHLRPIVYRRNAGMISQEAIFSIASPFILPHAILGADDKVRLLTHAGIVVADTDDASESTNTLQVLVTQARTDGRIIASHDGISGTKTAKQPKVLTGVLKINQSQRHLEFDFTAFHFSDPDNLSFRYKLVGLDNGWTTAETERTASYSRLVPGDYEFCVQASINGGPWQEPSAKVDFEVVPFVWQTWWFRTGTSLIVALCLAALVRYISYRRFRVKLRIAEQEAALARERGRIARDIHDDLGNRLTEIQLLTGLAAENREISRQTIVQIYEISSAARQATDALDEIVWAINPSNDTLPHLINYLGQFITDYLRTAGIQCRVDLPDDPQAITVSAEVRHNLFLAIKESLSNIVRHSGAKAVSLQIHANDSLRIIIQDDGRGFSGDVKNNGADGLKNMRQRIAEIHGTFLMNSRPETGTRITIEVPWLAK